MTIEKLKQFEPLFGQWYVEAKVAEGRNSKVFKVSKTEEGKTTYMCLKSIRFPRSNNEVSNAIASGKYANVDEYLSVLEAHVCENMDKMLQLKENGNIVRFEKYDIIKESSCFYVVMLMELLTPLSDYLKADKIRPKEVIKIGWDLCNALEGFRHEGIMHHNIRPDNIYVDPKGNYKLGDFGISDVGEEIREPGAYTAPELLYDTAVDSSSDIYSLGVVLYKLLNNNRGPFLPAFPAPISLTDREQATAKRLRGDLMPTPANADYNLAKIIFKAAAFRPAERYEAPFLMRIDFENYLKALAAAPAKPAPKAHAVAAQVPRRPRADGAQSVTDADKDDFAEAFTDDEQEEETPDKKWYFIIMALVIVLALVIGLVVKSVSDRNKESSPSEEITTSATEVQTTEEPSTEEATTEETTTEETTTEVTTTEETTTEETTTEETTTEVTTTEPSTEETTTEAPTAPEDTTDPILVGTVNTAGSQNEDGKYFINIETYAVTDGLTSINDKKISLEIGDDLGETPEPTGDFYIYMMAGAVNIQTLRPQVTLQQTNSGTYLCTVTVHDEEFFYAPSDYQYFLCFEEGAIESETSVILPLQIKL